MITVAEWTMHQLMRSEGIISPKYDFMQFVLNRKIIGIYGYEQHFDNYFLTDNKKLIGPIIRHNDDGYWDKVLYGQVPSFPYDNNADTTITSLSFDLKIFIYCHDVHVVNV
jgi:hypothetical protein